MFGIFIQSLTCSLLFTSLLFFSIKTTFSCQMEIPNWYFSKRKYILNSMQMEWNQSDILQYTITKTSDIYKDQLRKISKHSVDISMERKFRLNKPKLKRKFSFNFYRYVYIVFIKRSSVWKNFFFVIWDMKINVLMKM